MKRILFWVGVLVSILLLAVALSGLHLDEFWSNLQRLNLLWLIPGIALYFVSVWFRSWRWSLLLRPLGASIAPAKLFPIVVIGYMGNNIYPARIGEVIRSWILKRNEGMPVPGSLATIVIERVIDGLLMVAFVIVGLPAVPSMTDQTLRLIYIALIAFGAVIVVFFWMALAPAAAERVAMAVITRLVPHRFQDALRNIVVRFVAGAASLRNPADLARIMAASLITWLIETGKYACVAQAFGLSVSFIGLMLVNGVSNLFTIIPGAPGAVGTFDAGGILAMVALGVPKGLASAYILVLHVALWVPVTALGAVYMLRQGLHWADLRRAEEARS